MDKVTEQSAEFGGLSAEREVFFAADTKVDGRMEFNAPEDGFRPEQAGSDPEREILGQGEHAETNRQNNRKVRRRRNLLLQMAAAGMSVVVVTSSMGVDLLGSNALFGEEMPPIQDEGGIGGPGDEWVEEEFPETDAPEATGTPAADSWLRIYTSATESWVICENGEFVYNGVTHYQVGYDGYFNTLYLENDGDVPLDLYMVEAYHMGSSFTISVDDPEGWGIRIGKIVSYGSADGGDGSVTIAGEEGSMLYINPDAVHETGLHIDAGGGPGRLMVHKEVTVDISGAQQAVLVEEALAFDGGIDRERPYVICSGTVVSTPVEETEDTGVISNMGSFYSVYNWTVADESGAPARNVVFRRGTAPLLEGVEVPEGSSVEEYGWLSVTPSGSTEPVVLASFGKDISVEMEGLSYDPETKTLTLTNFTCERIHAQQLGYKFTIYLRGDNHIGQIYTQGDASDTSSASVTIAGDNGATLAVNENRTYPVGILLASGESPTNLTMKWGIDVEVCGTAAAVLVADTNHTAGDGIVLDEYLMADGPIVYGEYAGGEKSYATDWTITESYDSLAAAKELYIVSGRGG